MWKLILAFCLGAVALPVAVVCLLLWDDNNHKREQRKLLEKNRWNGSCPLPACEGRPMCNSDGRPACDVLEAVRGGLYDQIYGDDD